MSIQSESVDEKITEFLNYSPLDPLDYEEFDHDRSDWDNVPLIVTKFITYLSKNLQGLANKCKTKFSEEAASSVRVDLQLQIDKMNENLLGDKRDLGKAQQEFDSKIQILEEKFQNLKEMFKESQKFSESMATDNMYDFIPIPAQDLDMTSRFPSIKDLKGDTIEKDKKSQLYMGSKIKPDAKNPNLEVSWMNDEEFLNPEFFKARMFTLNQIRDLIYLHLSRSELSKKMSRHETLVEYHDNALFDQGRAHKKFCAEVDSRFKATHEEQDKTNTEISELILRYNKRITDINRTLSSDAKKLYMLREDSDYLQKHLDLAKAKIERFNEQNKKEREILEQKIQTQKNGIADELVTANKRVDQEIDNIKESLTKNKDMILEVIEITKGTIIGDVDDHLENMKLQMDSTKEDIDNSLKHNQEEAHKKVSKIKDICSTYFDKYDKVNAAVEKKFEKVNSTFEEWKEKVIKPLNMSEARLYTVEIRLKEFEGKIYTNFAHSKEMFKKLIFALEQESLPTKASVTSSIPNGLGQAIQVNSGEASHHSGSQEMNLLFLKRLLFIKNEIDEQISDGSEQEEIEKTRRIQTPSFHIRKKVSQISTDLFKPKQRVATVSVRHRKKDLRSMSPLKMFKKKDIKSKHDSQIKLDIFKKSMYSGTHLFEKEKKGSINPKHVQSLSLHIDRIRREAAQSYDLKDNSSQILN
ncbi:unnamed protein product [Moneuplotes crassus]|uniref:Uncharacterized protein n=1 Tax=Euplotes crassus TaxID=5936 RepID=A0AAD1Y8D2_EUPCR|nr:unnamed protein product [Moneuplotes crassus]